MKEFELLGKKFECTKEKKFLVDGKLIDINENEYYWNLVFRVFWDEEKRSEAKWQLKQYLEGRGDLIEIYRLISFLESELENLNEEYEDVEFPLEKLKSFEHSINGLEKINKEK